MKKAFTLLELMVVVIILGIVAAITIPGYRQVKDRALLKEANACLNLIVYAEKIYASRHGNYIACGDGRSNDVCNTSLHLELPTDHPNWYYVVAEAGGTWEVRATRSDGSQANPPSRQLPGQGFGEAGEGEGFGDQ